MSKLLFIFLLWVLILFAFSNLAQPSLAENFVSTSFKIDFGNLNLTGGGKTSPSFNLTDTVGQNAPGQYDGATFTLKSGFQYIYDTLSPFKFSISDLDIPFGTLTPGVGTSATNVLTITTPYGSGYDILAVENHPLWNQYSQPIPDTTCDTGTCSESVSAPWVNTTTYGFGFKALGAGTSTTFTNPTHYRQFANGFAGEAPQIIATETISVKDRQTTVTYKVNINNLQAAGSYQNGVIFIAVPKY